MTLFLRLVRRCGCIGLGLYLLAFQGVAYAQQTTGTISGTVKDSTAAILPGATVTATNTGTQASRTIVTDADGRYILPDLSLGAYQIRCELQGFRSVVRSGVTLTVGRHAVVDMALQVGDMSENIVVTGEAPLVNTTSAELGGLIDERQIRDLPLNSRSFTDLALFQTGVRLSRVTPTGGITTGSYGTMMTISGARPEANVYKLDGTDVSDVWQKGTGAATGFALGVEAIREFQVLSHNYGAEQGKFSGGVVNVVTRSGTDQWHGTAFEFHRNDSLDARNFFDLAVKPEFRRNQFGAAVGGTIVKHRTFVFGNYEGLRDRLGNTVRARVPTAVARQGQLQNPVTLAFVPVSIKPEVRPFLDLYPLPSPGGRDFLDGTAEYVTTVLQPSAQDYGSVRLDHNLGANDSLFGRYTSTSGSVVRPTEPYTLFNLDAFNGNHYLTIEGKHVFGPRLLTVQRFGYSRTRIGEVNMSLDERAGNGPTVLVPGKLMPEISPSGVSTIGPSDALPEIFTKNLYDVTYELIYSSGPHQMKAAIQVQREGLDAIFQTRQNGRWAFPGLRDFLQGTNVSRVQIAPPEFADPARGLRQWYGASYVQDDFRLRSNLTLNLGLRIESTSTLTEKDGKTSFLPEARFRDGSNRDLVMGGAMYENPGPHWAPRVGFAWDTHSTGKTVVRGGLGLYYDHIMPFWMTIGAWRMYPNYNVIEANRLPDGSPLPFPLTSSDFVRLYGAQSNQVWQFQREPDQIRTYHYSLGMQQQLGADFVVKFAYVGTRGTHLGSITAHNDAQPISTMADGRPFFGPLPHRRANPTFSIIDIMTTNSNSSYDSGELEVSKRLSHGFQFQGSYTFAKMMDDKAGIRTAGDPEGSIRRDFADLTLRALSPFDVRHNFSLNMTYEIPSIAQSRVLRAAFGGWQVNTLLMLASGHPFTVTQTAAAGDLKGIYRPDLVSGRDVRSDVVLGGPAQYFDPTAFAFSDPQRFGNVGRNTLIGPGLQTLDVSLNRQIVIRGFKVQFRSEFFNVLNHANFALPSSNVFDSRGNINRAAGQITKTSTSARQIQLGVKVLF